MMQCDGLQALAMNMTTWVQPFVSGLVFNRGGWLPIVIVATLILFAVMIFNYASHRMIKRWDAWAAILLKTFGFALLGFCLLEPMNSYRWPRPQENVVGILADQSASMTIGLDAASKLSLQNNVLDSQADWQRKIAEDFKIRRYKFGDKTQTVDELATLKFDQTQTNLGAALIEFERRWKDRPVAASFVFTDGNATDLRAIEQYWATRVSKAAIFPVIVQTEQTLNDLQIKNVVTGVSNFERAPVTFDILLGGRNVRGQEATIEVIDDGGNTLVSQDLKMPKDRDEISIAVRLETQIRGVQAYSLFATLKGDKVAKKIRDSNFVDSLMLESKSEITLANNLRNVIVDRGTGPYRILYIAGRPNWEFKFIRRAVAVDREIDLVGLLRIAKREAKFAFRDQSVDSGNTLFSGFENNGDDSVEQFDEPVFTRLGIRDPLELKDGFPDKQADLFKYQMIVVDDLEASFFTPTQLQLLRQFVSQRGGTLLMLGGTEAFRGREFFDGPLAQLSPFYIDDPSAKQPTALRYSLTREGWLEPSLRLQNDQAPEQERLSKMPIFAIPKQVRGAKPGAVVYAQGQASDGSTQPILAVQRFGQGKSATLLVNDFWRWALQNPPLLANEDSESLKPARPVLQSESAEDQIARNNPALIAWRQMFRWLINDVPNRLRIEPVETNTGGASNINVHVRDEKYLAQDNAKVELVLQTPDKKSLTLATQVSATRAGLFAGQALANKDGAYIVTAKASELRVNSAVVSDAEQQTAVAGFVIETMAEEFRSLSPNIDLLEQLAKRTGGRVLRIEDLNEAAAGLVQMDVPESITRTEPIWHNAALLGFALLAIASEWGLRRWRGLP